jgi:hypothetical protein
MVNFQMVHLDLRQVDVFLEKLGMQCSSINVLR